MDELLQRLDKALLEVRPEYYARLQPGLLPEETDTLEQKLGVTLPVDFKRFLQWRDGQRIDDYEGLWCNRSLMNHNSILETWQVMTGLLEAGEFDRSTWWNRAWIPFLENGGGDNIVLDLEGSFGGVPGQVLEFWHDWEQRNILFPNFARFIETLVAALENGFTNEDDDDIFDDAYEAINPGYPIKSKAG